MDLKIVGANLPGYDRAQDIGITAGIIVEIAEVITSDAKKTIDARGQVVIPGLIDAHLHLDKVFLLDRTPSVTGTFDEAMRETLNAKRDFTIAEIQSRATRAIEQSISWGVTAVRSHVEVDPIVQLVGLQALLPLKKQYAWAITLQLAVFAQEGITNQPGTEALLHKAMQLGGEVIGSAPYVDPDPEQNIRIVFEIAKEFDRDVDFHLDFLDDDAPLLLPFVIEQTVQRGWQNRVCLGHMTKLAGLPPAELAAIADATQAAGISILALPASDLYMMARKDTHNVRRGVAPVQTLATLGVNTGLATNNVQNLFTPFGDGDVLKICTLLAQVLQLGTVEAQTACLEMATTKAAIAINLKNHGLAIGNTADLVILNARSITEVIATAPVERTVIKNGNLITARQLQQQWFTMKD